MVPGTTQAVRRTIAGSPATSVSSVLDGLRLRNVVTLRVFDADVGKTRQHVGRVDAFGDGVDAHGLADLCDGLDEPAVDTVVRDVVHELTVDLQEVDRQVLQEDERREPAAEVVQGEPAAALAQLADEVLGVGEATHRGSLGHLEAQRTRAHVGGGHLCDHEIQKLLVVERRGRNVDGQHVRSAMRVAAAMHMPGAGLTHDPAIERRHQVEALRCRDELRRLDHQAVLVFHAQQQLQVA